MITTNEWINLLTSDKPGTYIMKNMSLVNEYPELKNTIGVRQERSWHPEGVLETHIEQVMNFAARIATRETLNDEERLVLVLGALLHDIGKPITTEVKNINNIPRITSPLHDIKGVELANLFMTKIGLSEFVKMQVLPLVRYHMIHISEFNMNSKKHNIRQISEKLHKDNYNSNIKMLTLLIEADCSGRLVYMDGNSPFTKLPETVIQMIEHAKLNNVYTHPIPKKDLSLHFITLDNNNLNEVQNLVHQIELEIGLMTYDEAIKFVEDYLLERDAITFYKIHFNTTKDIIDSYHIEGKTIGDTIELIKNLHKQGKVKTREDVLLLLNERYN